MIPQASGEASTTGEPAVDHASGHTFNTHRSRARMAQEGMKLETWGKGWEVLLEALRAAPTPME